MAIIIAFPPLSLPVGFQDSADFRWPPTPDVRVGLIFWVRKADSLSGGGTDQRSAVGCDAPWRSGDNEANSAIIVERRSPVRVVRAPNRLLAINLDLIATLVGHVVSWRWLWAWIECHRFSREGSS